MVEGLSDLELEIELVLQLLLLLLPQLVPLALLPMWALRSRSRKSRFPVSVLLLDLSG
jgi:hypothetical protein